MKYLKKGISSALCISLSMILLMGITGCNSGVSSTSSSSSQSGTDSMLISDNSEVNTLSGDNLSGNVENVDNSQTASGEQNNTNGTKSSTTEVTTSGNTQPADTSGYVSDLKGRTITYGYNTYFPSPSATTTSGKKTLEYYQQIEKKLNCKIVWNPKKLTHEQVLISIQSGKPEVDIIMSWGVSDLYDYYSKKYVTALDKLKVVDFSDLKTYGEKIQYSEFNGNYYGIPVKDAGWGGIPLLFYNKAALKKAGYTPESLNKLQESGQWTWSTFQSVLEKVKAAGTEKPLSDGALYFYNMLMASNQTDWVSKNSKGGYTFTADSPKAVEVMNYYAQLTQLGLVENAEAGDVSDIWYDINFGASARSAFWVSWAEMTQISAFPSSDLWGAMYPPKRDSSSKYVTPNNTIQFYSVAAGVNKPAEVLTVMSEMVKPFMTEAEVTASRKATVTAVVSDKYTLENFMSAGKIETFTNTDFASAANVLKGVDKDGWNYQVAKIASGQMTTAQAIAKYKKIYNNRLSELYG